MYTTRIYSLVSFKEMTSCLGRRSTTLFSSGLTYSTIRHAILFFICSSRHQQIAISPVASSFRLRSITYQFRLSFPILRCPTRTVSHILLPIHTTLSTCWLVYTDSVTNDLITFLEPRNQGLQQSTSSTTTAQSSFGTIKYSPESFYCARLFVHNSATRAPEKGTVMW